MHQTSRRLTTEDGSAGMSVLPKRRPRLGRRALAAALVALLLDALILVPSASAQWSTGWSWYRSPIDLGSGLEECARARQLAVIAQTRVRIENYAYYQWSNPCISTAHPLPRPAGWLSAQGIAFSGAYICSLGTVSYNADNMTSVWGWTAHCPGEATVTGGLGTVGYYHPNLGGSTVGEVLCADNPKPSGFFLAPGCNWPV